MLQKLKKFLNFKVEKRTNSEENAFACIAAWDGNFIGSNGLTKREYFAGLAMQGMFSQDGFLLKDTKELSEIAVKCADALLEELSKPKN
jgi:hypothetical protein